MMDKAKNIGELLIRYRKISQDDLEGGLKKQKKFGPSRSLRSCRGQRAKGEGMQLPDQSIMEFLMQNIISPEEAYMKANDKKTFERFLKQP